MINKNIYVNVFIKMFALFYSEMLFPSYNILVLSSVAHCGMEETNVINNPFPLQKGKKGKKLAILLT